MSKEDKGSLENIMDAVVSIHGGEVSLKNGNPVRPYETNSRLNNQRRVGTD